MLKENYDAVYISIGAPTDKKLGIPAVILASLIAFSRLYHFVHFPTDVMVGILIGTTVAILVHAGYLRWSRRHFS